MYKVYIYDLTNTVVAQIDEVLDVEISKKINDVSTASFGLFHTNPYCTRTFLKQYRRVKINLVSGNTEQTMFDGVIRGFEADLTKASIKLESFEHYFDRRQLHSQYVFSIQTIDSILTTILGSINIRYNTNITLNCGITTTTTKTYEKGETFLKVLKDLASLGYEFEIRDMVLIFKTTIGIDRTGMKNWDDANIWDDFAIWIEISDFLEYRYDINEPEFRSIDGVKMLTDGKELATGVIGKSGASFTELDDPTSIAEFGLIETTITNSGDQATETATYLADHKQSLSEFDIDAVSKDFFETNLGDIVKAYLYVGNDVLFYDGVMKVVQKSFRSGDLPMIKCTLSKGTMTSKNILDRIVDIQDRVKYLELK